MDLSSWYYLSYTVSTIQHLTSLCGKHKRNNFIKKQFYKRFCEDPSAVASSHAIAL